MKIASLNQVVAAAVLLLGRLQFARSECGGNFQVTFPDTTTCPDDQATESVAKNHVKKAMYDAVEEVTGVDLKGNSNFFYKINDISGEDSGRRLFEQDVVEPVARRLIECGSPYNCPWGTLCCTVCDFCRRRELEEYAANSGRRLNEVEEQVCAEFVAYFETKGGCLKGTVPTCEVPDTASLTVATRSEAVESSNEEGADDSSAFSLQMLFGSFLLFGLQLVAGLF